MIKKDLIKTVIFSIVVSAIVLTAFFELKEFKEEDDIKEVKDRVLRLNTEDVSTVKLSPEGIALTKSGENWKLTSPVDDVVPSEIVDKWISSLLALDGRILGSEKDSDLVWSDFGFLTQSRKILFTTKKGEESLVIISDKEAFDGSTYLKVRRGRAEDDLLITSDTLWKSETLKKPYDFRSKKLFNWSELSSKGKPVLFKVANQAEKEYYELNLKKEETSEGGGEKVWRARRRKKWGIDKEALEAYFNELKSEDIIAFAEPDKFKKGKSQLKFDVTLSSGEKISLEILKEGYTTFAKVSYRPDVVFKISGKTVKSLYKPLLELKSKKDFYFYDLAKVESFLYKKGEDSYRVKNENDVWVLKNKSVTPKNKEFNGAMAFEMFKNLKNLGGVRYVKSNTLFYTSKKRINLYNSKNNLYFQLEIGQKFPTKFGSRTTDGYLARSNTSSELLVIEKKKVDDLFKINFFQKKIVDKKTTLKPKEVK